MLRYLRKQQAPGSWPKLICRAQKHRCVCVCVGWEGTAAACGTAGMGGHGGGAWARQHVTTMGCRRAQSPAARNAHQLHHSRITCIPATTLVVLTGGMESECGKHST